MSATPRRPRRGIGLSALLPNTWRIERRSAAGTPNRKAEHVRDALIATMKDLSAYLRGSVTWDQGAALAGHKQISIVTDTAIYFCNPASPWQRGRNENTQLEDLIDSPADFEHVAQELNGRSRKTLGWETPAERLRHRIAD